MAFRVPCRVLAGPRRPLGIPGEEDPHHWPLPLAHSALVEGFAIATITSSLLAPRSCRGLVIIPSPLSSCCTIFCLWRNWANPPTVVIPLPLPSLSALVPLPVPFQWFGQLHPSLSPLTRPSFYPVSILATQISPIHCSLRLARPLDWSNTRFLLGLTPSSTKPTWCLAREHAVALAFPTRQPHLGVLAPSSTL